MDYFEVKEWITKNMKEGYSAKEIKEYLLSLNYPEEIIDRAIGECLKSNELIKVQKHPKIGLKVYIGFFSLVVIITMGLFFLINFRHSKIETANIQENNFMLLPGDRNTSVLILSGEGEAKITVKNISEWVSAPNTVKLSSSLKKVNISIEIPSDVTSGTYSGYIVISTKENTKKLPLTIVINNPPILNSVNLSSSIVRVEENITFMANITDRDNDRLTIFVFSDSAYNGEWCHGEGTYCSAFISENESVGEKKYYIKICDNISCSSIISGVFNVTVCINDETISCTNENGCDGIQTCEDEKWSSCVSTKNWCDEDCDGIPETCKSGSCKSCSCVNSETKSCNNIHGCTGIQTCEDEKWSSCVSTKNWCDEDCDGIPETCKSGSCKSCPTGHIYYAYNHVCPSCRNLAYDLIEDVIGPGTPHYGVELKLWTDETNDTITPYLAKHYDDFMSDHLAEIKADWISEGIHESSFPKSFSNWTSENCDILNSSGSYICVCNKMFNCYCDDLMGIQPPTNGCIDTNPGCSHETFECAEGTCTEMLEPMVDNALESFGI